MKFDVVIGNPPYNNDLYLDFVYIGKSLSNRFCCMITPAKWQGKGGTKNDQFREDIVPFMSKVVFYPVASDIFDIAEPGGIAYYLINKTKQKPLVKTISDCNRLNCDYEYRSDKLETPFNTSVIKILEKCCKENNIISRLTLKNSGTSFLRSFYLHESFKTLQVVSDKNKFIGCYSGYNNIGYVSKDELYTTELLDKWKITQTIMLSAGVWAKIPNYGISALNKISPNNVPIGSYPIIAVFDTEAEADSFISYVNCKLVKFLHYIGINATTETSEFWRYIPNPDAFDHIFTDDELYKKYNLTQEEISIIESVIKERK